MLFSLAMWMVNQDKEVAGGGNLESDSSSSRLKNIRDFLLHEQRPFHFFLTDC